LASDIESLARPVSAWVRKSLSGEEMAGDLAEAIALASIKPGNIATLIVPHDCQLEAPGSLVQARAVAHPPHVGEDAIKRAVETLRSDEPAVLFLGAYALRERGLRAVARIAAAVDCKLMCESFPARWERGVGTPIIERLPYFPEPAIAALAPYKTVLLAGARSPVSFFGYPGLPSYFISPQQTTVTLATADEDVEAALEALADALGAPVYAETNSNLQTPQIPNGKLTPESLSAVVASLLPDNAIVMDESNTSMGQFLAMSQSAPRHTILTQPGGAIGLGLPCATGAAVACPDRIVINLQADGSAMYTVQALWTQAREQLNVKTIKEFGKQSQSMIGLRNPLIDWVSISKGLGVPAVRVETAEDLANQLERALAESGPQLIEAVL
jgi:acetolactate synthase-1/2/3 large subunit